MLALRRAQAEYMFRRIGITFGVYGDKDAAERPIPFDAVRNQCADDAYVRVAVGFDALGAAPFRAAQSGGGSESIDAAVKIEQAAGQSQN